MKLDKPICMDEVYTHQKGFLFDDDGMIKYGKSDISIMVKQEVIHERFRKGDYNIRLHIKQKMHKIVYIKLVNVNTLG